MAFLESVLALLLLAILLLQVSRRLSLPYPAMLAAAGTCVALVPGSPAIRIEPDIALAVFIAPALVDAAFDFPAGAIRRLWRPLLALAGVAVLLTAGAVTAIGVLVAGLPLGAALALGAIVAPPDAAAATAVLGSLSLPRRTTAVLKGESLLNDATALLLYDAALSLQGNGGLSGHTLVQLGVAAPGGVLLGAAIAWIYRRIVRFVSGTLGGNLLEFATTFSVWILADHLHLSPVLCLVAFAMTIARGAGLRQAPWDRVHSFAVWSSVVFLLNVLAFLLMGMQAKTIIVGMPADRLVEASGFAAIVVATVIGVRIAWTLAYNRLAALIPALRGDGTPPTAREGLLVGWCGMRGLLTLATAFALPPQFPDRPLIVLTAFAVVLATLVVQGFTLAPLVRLLGLGGGSDGDDMLKAARRALTRQAIDGLAAEPGEEAERLRAAYRSELDAVSDPPRPDAARRRRRLGLAAITAQRKRLEALRVEGEIDTETFYVLQEELDWKELSLTSEDKRRIEES